jgi:hypothetical protein
LSFFTSDLLFSEPIPTHSIPTESQPWPTSRELSHCSIPRGILPISRIISKRNSTSSSGSVKKTTTTHHRLEEKMLAMTTKLCCTLKVAARDTQLRGTDCVQTLLARASFCTPRGLQAVQRHRGLAKGQQARPDLRNHRCRRIRADAPLGMMLRLLMRTTDLTAF